MSNWLTKGFNTVKKYVTNPTTWITGGLSVQADLADKVGQHFGADLFGNKQQKINNSIARENNQLQRDSYEFNKDMASKTFETNKDIAYNGSQIKSADMAKAGLNPLAGVNSSPTTISASSVNNPNLSQPDNVSQTGLQKIQTIAGLAMQAKQLQSSLASSAAQNKSIEAQTRYQELVNDYFNKYGVLPTQQNEWIAQLLPLFSKLGNSNIPSQLSSAPIVGGVVNKVVDANKRGSREAQDSVNKFKSMPDLSKLTKPAYFKLVFTGAGMKKFPANEKGFLDWCKTKDGQLILKNNNRNLIRDYFFWISR